MSTRVRGRNYNNRDGALAVTTNNNNNNNDEGGDITNNNDNGDISSNDTQSSRSIYNQNYNGNNDNNDNSEITTANGDNSSANNINDSGNTGGAASTGATLDQTTKTIYAASIVAFVSLALQILVLSAVLTIWLRRRKFRLREGVHQQQQQKTCTSTITTTSPASTRQQKGLVSGYGHPMGYWNLPSNTQLPLHQSQEQHGGGGAARSPWQDVPPYSSPARLPGPDAAAAAAATCQVTVVPPPARASNCAVRSELG